MGNICSTFGFAVAGRRTAGMLYAVRGRDSSHLKDSDPRDHLSAAANRQRPNVADTVEVKLHKDKGNSVNTNDYCYFLANAADIFKAFQEFVTLLVICGRAPKTEIGNLFTKLYVASGVGVLVSFAELIVALHLEAARRSD